ncbi:ValinetRNA ligaselike [Caligus rogercresseyi]|uniref:valine--tRNA ligase n=1 Tax=Caligus rogercresseyi TaxID=217165 RepID=A0A7T8HEX8_CALRO|nr:ValinetRNA ligaselike [Caligus rogercresseyi]
MNALTSSERKALPKGPGGVLRATPSALTLVDRWILSRLSYAVSACEEGIHNGLYNFWLYEMCDVYLEYLKPIFQGNDSGAILTSQIVLSSCLHAGLRLISIFMPFRLRSSSDPPSVCVSPYPKEEDVPFRDEDWRTKWTWFKKCQHTAKNKTELILKTFDDSVLYLSEFSGLICTLSCSKALHVIKADQKVPPGGYSITVSDKVLANVLLEGVIDPSKELERINKKSEMLKGFLQKFEEITSVPDYKSKVPQEVQNEHKEKIEQLKKELRSIKETAINIQKS